MHFFNVIFFSILLLQYSCSDPADPKPDPQKDQGTLARREKIKMLEAQVKSLRWENTRLALKVRTVDGNRMVKDKPTGLWHYDVERIPYTGMVVEKFPDGTPRGEASFIKGRKDGRERFWYPNGKLKEESHWFDGQPDGIMQTWNQEGEVQRIVRFKRGELIEVLKE